MSRFLLLIFITAFYLQGAVVRNIRIVGNIKTQAEIILREIEHPIPAEFDPILAQSDRNRIYNLGLFSTVQIYQDEDVFVVTVIETFYILPLPVVFYNEAKGKRGWSYGGVLIHNNFLGRNQKLEVSGTLGDIESFSIGLVDPWKWGDRIPFSIKLASQYSNNAVYSFGLRRNGLWIGSGTNDRMIHRTHVQLGYEHRKLISVSDSTKIDFVPGNTHYRHVLLQLGYVYDSRDIYWDPTRGMRASLLSETYAGFHNTESIQRLDGQLDYYIPGPWQYMNPIFALHTRFLLQWSDHLPVYAYQYLGGDTFVRGYSPVPRNNPPEISNRIQVVSLIYHSLECQMTLVEKTDYDGVEMGMDILLFLDYGYGTDKLSHLRPYEGILGFGMGFRFFLSGYGVMSLDLGFNPHSSDWRFHIRDQN